MLETLLGFVFVAVWQAADMAGAGLEAHVALAAPRAPAALIVGRARCRGHSWLVTDDGELVDITTHPPTLAIHRMAGLAKGERPWGLACLASDGSLWTMLDARVLARVGPDGSVLARAGVPRPRVGLFGVADLLLAQELPVAPGAPALIAHERERSTDRRPWPGLTLRKAGSLEDELTRNLVACGLPLGRTLPCWFADEHRVAASDGTSTDRLSFDSSDFTFSDPLVPVWDVALVRDGLWLLATSARAENGHRVGGRLYRVDARGRARASINLQPAARLIVSATADGCVLLVADGRLVEVLWR
jgi:hypothetical protein